MSNKMPRIVIVLLLLMVCVLLFLPARRVSMGKMPIFLPLTLEMEQRLKREHALPEQSENEMPEGAHLEGITVDDLVRGMLYMEKNSSSALSADQAGGIYPVLKQLASGRERILRLRNLRHQLNEELIEDCIKLSFLLSSAQLQYVLNNRDKCELFSDEGKSWNELLGFLENDRRK